MSACSDASSPVPGVCGGGGVGVGYAAARKHLMAHRRQLLDNGQVKPQALPLQVWEAMLTLLHFESEHVVLLGANRYPCLLAHKYAARPKRLEEVMHCMHRNG